MATSISHFLTAAIKFSCYSLNEFDILCFLSSGSSSFSVIHANPRQCRMKNRLRCCCFLSLKIQVATRFTAETRGYLKCKISPRLTGRGGATYERTPSGAHQIWWAPDSVWTIFSESKFFGCVDLPNFLTHGAPLRALRFLRTKIFWKRRFTKFSYPRCSAARASRARVPLWKGGAVLGLWYFPVVWDRNERWCRNIRGEIHPWHDSNSVSGMYVWSKSVYIQFWLC